MKFVLKALIAMLMISTLALAQEPELINEIVARVNGDIITRGDYLAALEDLKSDLARLGQQQGKNQAQIEEEFSKLKPSVLDTLIDTLLLEQKAKELGIDVEAEINQEMKSQATRYGFKDVLEFEKAIRQQGQDPDGIRATFRRQFQQQYVINQEVLRPIFQGLREQDRREYYEKNKETFVTPGEVTLSEIFVPLEGYTATEVEQRARRIVAEIRAGLDFAQAVQKYSAASRATRSQNGRMGAYKIGVQKGERELKEELEAAIANLKVGEITEPIRIQEGYQIIRLDDRKLPKTLPYDDSRVQNFISRQITMDRGEEARKNYLKKLRDEAFIRVTKGYETAQAAKQN